MIFLNQHKNIYPMTIHQEDNFTNSKNYDQFVSFGLIGAGMMGQEHIRNLKLRDTARVTTAFEPDENMRTIVSSIDPEIIFKDSLADLLNTHNIDAWIIASPNYYHFSQLCEILKVSPKPILIEKPVCISLSEAQKLFQLSKNLDIPVWTGMEYRYMPAIDGFIKSVKEKLTGDKNILLSIKENRYPFLRKVDDWNRFNAKTGGTLVEKCCHFFDLMRLIFNSEPSKIFASGAKDVNHQGEIYDDKIPDIIDNALVIVEFISGQRASLQLSMFAEGEHFQEEIFLIGNCASINARIPGPSRFWKPSRGDQPVAELTISPRGNLQKKTKYYPVKKSLLEAGDHNGATFHQHSHFLNMASGKGKIQVTLLDGIRAVMMGLAAQKSIKIGEPVDLTKEPFKL